MSSTPLPAPIPAVGRRAMSRSDKTGASRLDEEWTDKPRADWTGQTEDDALIRDALESRGSARAIFGDRATFRDLWEANEDELSEAFPSASGDTYDRSRADMALAFRLMRRTGQNCDRTLRLMRFEWARSR